MAVAVTAVAAHQEFEAQQSVRAMTNAFTPVAGRTYYVVAYANGFGGFDADPTCAFAGLGLGTLTLRARIHATGDSASAVLFSGTASGGTYTSGVVTVTGAGGTADWGSIGIAVYEASGQGTGAVGDGIQQIVTDANNGLTVSTLTWSAWQANSFGFAVFGNSSHLNGAPKAGWTEDFDALSATAFGWSVQTRATDDTTATYTTTNAFSLGIGIEILAAAGGGPLTVNVTDNVGGAENPIGGGKGQILPADNAVASDAIVTGQGQVIDEPFITVADAVTLFAGTQIMTGADTALVSDAVLAVLYANLVRAVTDNVGVSDGGAGGGGASGTISTGVTPDAVDVSLLGGRRRRRAR